MGNKTFTIIKPNAVAAGHTGRILDMITGAGFKIRALKMTCMSRNAAERFYEVHRGRPFFDNLVIFMTAGPVVVAVLEGEDAVGRFRELVGNTDPAKAAEGTLRSLFGQSLTRNSIHASDSDLNAAAETAHFFCEEEIMVADYSLPVSTDQIDS